MLKALRRIVQEVSSSTSLQESLQSMVSSIRSEIDSSATAVFLVDNRCAEFVLMASEGVKTPASGELRFSINEGLLGLVAHREEPLNIADAQVHENYFYHPAYHEDHFHGFLAVPIIHQRRLYGIVTLQQETQARFDESAESFVVTLCAQLAGLIAHADATGEISQILAPQNQGYTELDEVAFEGIAAVDGVGIGSAVVVYPPADLDAVPDKSCDDIVEEIQFCEQAILATRNEIAYLSQQLEGSLPKEELALFDVYVKILESSALQTEIFDQISTGLWAQGALRNVIKRHVALFESMEDDYLRERASDFHDLGRRILAHLQKKQPEQITYPDRTVLVGEEITASALAQVPEGTLSAIVSIRGSSTSHAAILARALGIPTVMGVQGLSLSKLNGRALIVDGYNGQVYCDPSNQLLTQYELLVKEEEALDKSLEELRGLDARTPDGHAIKLMVNTGLAADAGLSLSVGAEGVGLFRTEVPFMARDRFPVEEEQRVIYRQLLKAFAPRDVTMRMLDIGGDKPLSYFPVNEENPFLGWRGIRITLDHPDLFLVQTRAMLRANQGLNNLKILLPMISSVGEVDESIHLIRQAYDELIAEGLDIVMPPLGVMIEVPSAVYQARHLAERVDFLSVGSNDLTQYLLAVDRNNPRVSGLYDALHPAVLQALIQVVEGAHSQGKLVGICGEMASDPAAVILLLAMGFDNLSMNSMSLPRMKWVIRNVPMTVARKLLSEVLQLDNAIAIRFLLEKALEECGLGGLNKFAGNSGVK